MGTIVEAPAARVTVVWPRLETSAAGPARLKSKLSFWVPVFVTFSSRLPPGLDDIGLR